MKSVLRFVYAEFFITIVAIMLMCVIAWGLINKQGYFNRHIQVVLKYINVLLFVGSSAIILYATVASRISGERELCTIPFYSLLIARKQPEMYRSMLMNVFLFEPIGLTLPFVLPSKIQKRVEVTIAIGLLFSFSIEITQYIFCLGRAEVDDIICNTLGCIIGSYAYLIYKRRVNKRYFSAIVVVEKLCKTKVAAILKLLWEALIWIECSAFRAKWSLLRAKVFANEEVRVIENVTFIFKSFERQEMAKRLYKNIQSYYPGVKVIIADDSSKPLELKGENLEVIQLPFNSGLSYGLNRALERVTTPFVIRMDDDELLTPYTKFHEQLQFLLEHPEVDLVGVLTYALPRHKPLEEVAEVYFKQPMNNAPKKLIIPHLTQIDERRKVVGKAPNVFIARTDKIKAIGYDDNIRMIDHNEFFYRAAGNIVSVLDTTCYVLHTHNPFDRHYQKYRSDYQGDLEYIRAKHGVTVKKQCNTNEKFLGALRASLQQNTVSWDTIQNQEGQALFRLALQQDVYPMIYEAVRGCKAMEPYYAQLRGVSEKAMQIVAKQIVKTTEFLQMYQRLCSAGARPLVVKGLICRDLYPVPDHRPSTDEDLFIRWDDFEICHKEITKFGMRLVEEEQNVVEAHEVLYWKGDSKLHIELHKELFPPDSEASGDFNAFFEGVHERAIKMSIQGVDVYTLSYTDHMLFLMCHAFKHFQASGLGIRPVCDIMLFANEYGQYIDWSYLLNCCKKIHAEVLMATLFRIGEKYLTFNAQKACYPSEWTAYEKDEKELLDDLLDGGTLGNKDLNRIHSSNVTLNAVKADKRGEKAKSSVWASVFPPVREMKKNYQYLERHSYLLPIAWASRIIKYGKEIRAKENSNPAESLAIGKRRVELLKKYDVVK